MKAWQKKKIVEACEYNARTGGRMIACNYRYSEGIIRCLCPMSALVFQSGDDVYDLDEEGIAKRAAKILKTNIFNLSAFIDGYDGCRRGHILTGELAKDWNKFGKEVYRWIFP